MSSAVAVAHRVEPEVSSRTGHSQRPSLVLPGVTTLLFFAPLAFGAVEPWSVFALESGAALLFLLWTIQQARSGVLRIVPHPLHRPMLAFVAIALLQIGLRQTAYRAVTLSSALLYLAYGLLCFLLVQSQPRISQLKRLTMAISAFGGALAAFAVLQSLTSNNRLYWLRTPRFGGWIYGPYVNHNHYAGLMEMLFPFPVAVALSRHASRRTRILCGAAAVLMASTIFFCGSRGGMLAFCGQIVLLAALLVPQKRNIRKQVWMLLPIAVLALMAFLGGDELISRLSSVPTEARFELSGGTRISIDRDALRMFTHRPLLGWGLGTFADVYPQFRSFPTNLLLDQAHNDYLQLLVETGAVGFLVMVWFLIALYRRALKNWKDSVDSTSRNVALAAILGITGILIHSFLDFNLQIPANAAWFCILCTLAAMKIPAGHGRGHSAHPPA